MTHKCKNYSNKGRKCEGEWVVLDRNCNYSAFNGGHRTPSDYSAVKCLTCRTVWRTKADYVNTLRDASPGERMQ